MFLNLIFLRFFLIYVYLWGDYIKILIFLEFITLILLLIMITAFQYDYFSLNYFLIVLIFLVCESRIGFLLFIFYIRIENEVVKKFNIVQF